MGLVNVLELSRLPYAADDHQLFYIDEAGKYGPTVEQSFTGFAVSGRVGAGKTRFGIQTIAKSQMLAGYGMLFACPKPDTFKQILEWARDCGREDDVVCVEPDGNSLFDMMSWLATRFQGRAVIREAVDVLKDASEVAERGRMTSSGGDNKFFDMMADRINAAVMTVDLAANGSISIERCLALIQTIPQSVEEARHAEHLLCGAMPESAEER